MTDDETAATAARARWRAAEDRLYPAVISDPAAYERVVAAVQAVIAELRHRAQDLPALLAVEADPADVVAAAGPRAAGLPADLLLGVACGMRDRELRATQERLRRERVVAGARAAGRAWAVLEGPEGPEALTGGGRAVAVHLPSGTVVAAAVDPWAVAAPFELQVVRAGGEQHRRTFDDRAEWLAEHERCRRDVESQDRATPRTRPS